jgi:magnesium chelatase family protein
MKGYVMVGLEPIAVEIACTAELSELEGFDLKIGVDASDAAIRESRVRLVSALSAIGVYVKGSIAIEYLPKGVSLAELDLVIAVSVLEAVGKIAVPEGAFLRAELALDGKLRPLCGTYAALAKLPKAFLAIVAPDNRAEAEAAGYSWVVSPATLAELVRQYPPQKAPGRFELAKVESDSSIVSAMRGVSEETLAKVKAAALERRSITLLGRPGSGGTLLARYFRSLLTLSEEQARDVMALHSVAGILQSPLQVPLRAPHHSVSEAGLVGGGDKPRPGEVSLAHGGVLLLDELQEFRMASLQAVRRVVTQGFSEIARAGARVRFPAAPCIVAVAPPCPRACREACRCTSVEKERYNERLAIVPTSETIEIGQMTVAAMMAR